MSSSKAVGPGFYEAAARRSVKYSTIGNALFLLFLIADIAFLMLIDPGVPRPSSTKWTIAVELVLGALAAWRLVVARVRAAEITKHPIFRNFARHGDPRAVAAEIEHAGLQSGRAVFTNRFLVAHGMEHGCVLLDDIAWIYPKRTKVSVNFVPVYAMRSIEVLTYSPAHRHASLQLDLDEPTLEQLQARAHRARFGYTPENQRWYRDVIRSAGRASTPSRA